MGITSNIKHISMEKAGEVISGLSFALIYNISDMKLGRVSETDIDLGECVEAFFWNESSQLHIFNGDDGQQAVLFEEPSDCRFIDREYPVRVAGLDCSRVTRREYIEYDEDGQVYVAYTRLTDLH